jgi:hypothetical protein
MRLVDVSHAVLASGTFDEAECDSRPRCEREDGPRLALAGIGALVVLLTAPAYAKPDDGQSPRLRAGLGLAVAPLVVEGLDDVHVSDWQTMGLGGMEGRVSMPLSEANNRGYAPGLALSASWPMADAIDLSAGLGVYVANAIGFTLDVGPDLIFRTDTYLYGARARVGFAGATADMGYAQQIDGYVRPVITPDGTFDDGDPISGSSSAFMANAGAFAGLRLTPDLTLRVDLVLQYASFGSFGIKAGEVVLDSSAPAIVKPDGSSDHLQLNVTGDMTGVVAILGVQYDFTSF